MLKILIPALAVNLLAGCSPSIEVAEYPMPTELADCTQHRLSDGFNKIIVVRCPNSTTSTTHRVGKTSRTNIVIDGVEYVPKQ